MQGTETNGYTGVHNNATKRAAWLNAQNLKPMGALVFKTLQPRSRMTATVAAHLHNNHGPQSMFCAWHAQQGNMNDDSAPLQAQPMNV